jgi:uncharacterized surface protein with fasciclin (FAS1) repeats
VKVRPIARLAAILAGAALLFAPIESSRADTRENIVETALKGFVFKTFCKVLLASDMVLPLQEPGPLTALVPTDKAFAKLEKEKPGYLANLMKPQNKAKLKLLVKYHVMRGRFTQPELEKMFDGSHMGTLAGKPITLHVKGTFGVNNSKVVNPDMVCSNGIIQVIDTVLIPPDKH